MVSVGRCKCQRAVWALRVVVSDVGTKRVREMAATDDEDVAGLAFTPCTVPIC
jgi:hypothetical protein